MSPLVGPILVDRLLGKKCRPIKCSEKIMVGGRKPNIISLNSYT